MGGSNTQDSITFGSVINACGKAGEWQLAVALLEESLVEGEPQIKNGLSEVPLWGKDGGVDFFFSKIYRLA